MGLESALGCNTVQLTLMTKIAWRRLKLHLPPAVKSHDHHHTWYIPLMESMNRVWGG